MSIQILTRVTRLRRVGIGLWLAKVLAKAVGLPNLAGILFTRIRLWIHPVAYHARRRWAQEFSSRNSQHVVICPADGYVTFSDKTFPSVDHVVGVCNEILDNKGRDKLDSWYENKTTSKSKNFFFNILEESDILKYPGLMKFALSDYVLYSLVPYYGMLPRLCSIGLYYSRVSSTRAGSQNFHLDGTDPHHIKCFINVSDVGPEDGPFTFIPACRTEELRQANGGILRSAGLENAELLSRYEKDCSIKLIGGPGTGAFVDTSRCLHYGSCCKENPRIVFMFHYAVFANYTNLDKNPLRDISMQHYPEICTRFGVDELRRDILRIS